MFMPLDSGSLSANYIIIDFLDLGIISVLVFTVIILHIKKTKFLLLFLVWKSVKVWLISGLTYFPWSFTHFLEFFHLLRPDGEKAHVLILSMLRDMGKHKAFGGA